MRQKFRFRPLVTRTVAQGHAEELQVQVRVASPRSEAWSPMYRMSVTPLRLAESRSSSGPSRPCTNQSPIWRISEPMAQDGRGSRLAARASGPKRRAAQTRSGTTGSCGRKIKSGNAPTGPATANHIPRIAELSRLVADEAARAATTGVRDRHIEVHHRPRQQQHCGGASGRNSAEQALTRSKGTRLARLRGLRPCPTRPEVEKRAHITYFLGDLTTA